MFTCPKPLFTATAEMTVITCTITISVHASGTSYSSVHLLLFADFLAVVLIAMLRH